MRTSEKIKITVQLHLVRVGRKKTNKIFALSDDVKVPMVCAAWRPGGENSLKRVVNSTELTRIIGRTRDV